MIRILICGSSRMEKGGMNSVIEQLMGHKWNKKLQISYLATHISGNAIKKAIFFGKAYIRLYCLIIRNKFDMIHIHMSYKGSFYRKYWIAKLCNRYHKKVILHLHGSEFKDFYYSGGRTLQNKVAELFSIVDCTIALGEAWKNFILSIAPKAYVRVISNAIPMPEYAIRKRHENVVFLFLGALIPRKGVMDLLIVANQLVLSGMNHFTVLIAGDGEERARLKQYCRKNGLDKNVKFLGWVDHFRKKELFSKSDVFVLPSYNEGLPIAILEAISYGLPVISTNVGSIQEAVIDGKNGYLYNPGNIDKLGDYIKIMIEDKENWEIFSKYSRKIAEESFSEEKFFHEIEKVYLEIGNNLEF